MGSFLQQKVVQLNSMKKIFNVAAVFYFGVGLLERGLKKNMVQNKDREKKGSMSTTDGSSSLEKNVK